MALQSLKAGLWLPNPRYEENYAPSGYVTLDASGELVAYVFRWPRSGNISKIGLAIGAITTNEPVNVRCETLSSGYPSGTLYHANAEATNQTLTASQINWIDFTDFPVTINDYVAIQLGWYSSVGSLQWNCFDDRVWGNVYGCNYTGSWAQHARVPMIGLEYDDGCYPCTPCNLHESYGATTIKSTGSVYKVALRFKLPFPAKLCAAWVYAYRASASATAQMLLYDDDGNAVSDAYSVFPDTLATSYAMEVVHFPSISIAKDTYYKLTIEALTSNAINILQYVTRDSASGYGLDCFEGGVDMHWQEYQSSGWQTPHLTKRPQMFLLFDAFDDGSPFMGRKLLRR